ncbi:MAG: ImuA protein [Hyphomicrobiales bacterium]
MPTSAPHRAAIDDLRRLLPLLEGDPAARANLPFGIPAIDAHLPQGGLPLGALHEVRAADFPALPAAFGFSLALLGRVHRRKPLILIAGQSLAEHGHVYYHGLPALGLDPERLIWVAPRDRLQSLWAMETALRSGVPAAVIAMITEELHLHDSQRLQLAAKTAGIPLVLVSARKAPRSNVAVTRWAIDVAPARRDRFGLIAEPRWRVKLERCRNGRPGEWLVEWNHVAYRFRLAAALADPALPESARDAASWRLTG